MRLGYLLVHGSALFGIRSVTRSLLFSPSYFYLWTFAYYRSNISGPPQSAIRSLKLASGYPIRSG